MRATKRTRRRLTWILIASVLAFATGCGGAASKRPYAASRAVLAFENAEWVEVDGRLVLVSATWTAEKEMTLEDVRYNFRRGAVLTPGFLSEILEELGKEKP